MRWVLALLLLAGCARHVDTAKTLEQARAMAAAQDDAALAKLDVDCRLTDKECGALRRLQAEACARIAAQPGLAPKPRRQALDCATGNFNAALAAWDRTRDAAGKPDEIAPPLLQLLAERRDLAADPDEARDRNRRLGFRAEALAAERGAAGQVALVHWAEATLKAAMLAGPTGGCDSVARAGDLLARAKPQGTAAEAMAMQLAPAIEQAKTDRGC
jgi:hypothetical protein